MRELTKWPRLLVVGTAVTEEQADEILIRTCVPAYLTGNDKGWGETVRRILGFVQDEWPEDPALQKDTPARLNWLRDQWKANDRRKSELGILDLNYLYTSRIASSWIGGPHGWCNWNGEVFSDNYNIGKWPDTGDLTEEWGRIAAAFPYLDLTAQVVTDEGEGELAGEWRVKDGGVSYCEEPGERISRRATPEEETEQFTGWMEAIFSTTPGRERGVSEDRLVQAVARVEAVMGVRRDEYPA